MFSLMVSVAGHSMARLAVARQMNAFWHWLPKGTRLPGPMWVARHRLLLTVAWLNIPFLGIIGLRGSIEPAHLVTELSIVLVLVAGVHVVETRTYKAVLTALALVSCSGLLVHLTDGLIESHFHFFVVIPLISLYRDWRPLAVGLGFVVAHHSIVGVVSPSDVFNHPAALANPVQWALLHGVYVLALTTVVIAYWRFSEGLEGALAREEALRRNVEAEKHQMETERLEHLVRSKDEFVASVSHELRTPLAAVMGFAEILRDDLTDLSDEERRELTSTIAQEAYDLAGIVEDLLVAARAEIDSVHISQVVVDLGANCAQVVEVLPVADRSRIRVAKGDGRVRAIADPVRVRQIIRNLVTNAIRYGGNRVHVEYAEGDERVVLTVRDDGSEIPPAERERIFLPYFSAHDPGSLPSSVGLGLTVSRQLADMMGGRLAYTFDDGWSTFTLELPSAALLEPADAGSAVVTVST
jgi:signal transduction histidine kinase